MDESEREGERTSIFDKEERRQEEEEGGDEEASRH